MQRGVPQDQAITKTPFPPGWLLRSRRSRPNCRELHARPVPLSTAAHSRTLEPTDARASNARTATQPSPVTASPGTHNDSTQHPHAQPSTGRHHQPNLQFFRVVQKRNNITFCSQKKPAFLAYANSIASICQVFSLYAAYICFRKSKYLSLIILDIHLTIQKPLKRHLLTAGVIILYC